VFKLCHPFSWYFLVVKKDESCQKKRSWTKYEAIPNSEQFNRFRWKTILLTFRFILNTFYFLIIFFFSSSICCFLFSFIFLFDDIRFSNSAKHKHVSVRRSCVGPKEYQNADNLPKGYIWYTYHYVPNYRSGNHFTKYRHIKNRVITETDDIWEKETTFYVKMAMDLWCNVSI